MAYLKINGTDFSDCVSELIVSKKSNYNAQTNAAGNTVIDLVSVKRTIEVGFIPLNNTKMVQLMNYVQNLGVSISFLNPVTGGLEEDVSCIVPDGKVEYYTIQTNNTRFKAFKLKFNEL